METNEPPEEQLRQVERAQTAPWVDYPPTPNWYYPAVGIWLASLCLAVVKVWDSWLWIFAILALLAAEGAMIGWMHSQRAAMPNLRNVPGEFAPLVKWFLLIGALILAITFALILTGFEFVGVAVCAIATTIGLYMYEQKFDAAADLARVRLDLT